MQTDILIIGGGLSGLYLARRLQAQGRDYLLIEARDRFGGRIHSPTSPGTDFSYDMGPAWFWPGQPRMAKLLDELSLPFFDQAATGNLVFQERSGNIRRDIDMASMEGAHRVAGGLKSVIDALVAGLGREKLLLNTIAHEITYDGTSVTVKSNIEDIKANKVILCLPPRLAKHSITFTPALPERTSQEMENCATWMAAHAKFVAVYNTPFWRDIGLSGDGISHVGPMMEMHDASPLPDNQKSDDQMDGTTQGQGAIFGFLGVPANARKGQRDAVIEACKQQLIALFGQGAANPIDVYYQDWAQEAFTATPQDANGDQNYPQYHPITINQGHHDGPWQNHLYLASTETAPQFGGFLEGALEAVDGVMGDIG